MKVKVPDKPFSFARDFEVVEVPLGELFTDHGVDPDTGAMLQRQFNTQHMALKPARYEHRRWLRDPPWVSERPELQKCNCDRCLKPQPGQVVRGRYHIMRGQHQVAGLRRWLMEFHPEINRSTFKVQVLLFKGLTRIQEAECLLEADRDRRPWNTRSLRAVEVSSGDPFMVALAEMMFKEFGYSVSGPKRLPAVQSLYKMGMVKGAYNVDAGIDVARRILAVWKDVLPPFTKPQGLQINAVGYLLNDPVNGKILARNQHILVAALSSHVREVSAFRSYQELAYASINWFNRRVRADGKKLRIPS